MVTGRAESNSVWPTRLDVSDRAVIVKGSLLASRPSLTVREADVVPAAGTLARPVTLPVPSAGAWSSWTGSAATAGPVHVAVCVSVQPASVKRPVTGNGLPASASTLRALTSGGAFRTLIVLVRAPVAPNESVTLRVTEYEPSLWGTKNGFWTVNGPFKPVTVHSHETILSPGASGSYDWSLNWIGEPSSGSVVLGPLMPPLRLTVGYLKSKAATGGVLTLSR